MQRVITYIDGFNLYYGMRSKHWRRYYWLDAQALAQSFIQAGYTLEHTKYFTARIPYPPDKVKRQTTYLEALATLSNFEIYYGKYLVNEWECFNCNHVFKIPSEKMSDVNIAVQMLTDAFQNRFDTAYLVSADSDLVPPVDAVKQLFPSKRVVAAFPPGRHSHDLRNAVDAHFTIGRKSLADCQLPEQITKTDGFVLQRPAAWR